ncbi:MAG: hypothetical protein K2W93_09320, partial [Burkholderiaceae bacterium]|nr:hypothetical protein [Burkholderiaceae bacterium]
MKSKNLLCIAAAVLSTWAGLAQAQSAGTWMARIGATTIRPDVKSGDLSAASLAGTKIDINNATQISGGITWMWTDNIAIDLPLAIPFKHQRAGHHVVEKRPVVAHDQQGPRIVHQQLFQQFQRFGVEIVRWFVEHQHIGRF